MIFTDRSIYLRNLVDFGDKIFFRKLLADTLDFLPQIDSW